MDDEDANPELFLLLHFLEDRVIEAAISLGLFDDALPARETLSEGPLSLQQICKYRSDGSPHLPNVSAILLRG